MTATLPLPLALPPKRAKTTFPAIPEDFQPSPHSLDWARQRGFDSLDLAYLTEQFVNHHLGHDSRWKDWQRAWMNWVLRAAHDNPKALNARATTSSRPQTLREIEQEIAMPAGDYDLIVSWDQEKDGTWIFFARKPRHFKNAVDARAAYNEELNTNGELDPGREDIRNVLIELRYKGQRIAHNDTPTGQERRLFWLGEVQKTVAASNGPLSNALRT